VIFEIEIRRNTICLFSGLNTCSIFNINAINSVVRPIYLTLQNELTISVPFKKLKNESIE